MCCIHDEAVFSGGNDNYRFAVINLPIKYAQAPFVMAAHTRGTNNSLEEIIDISADPKEFTDRVQLKAASFNTIPNNTRLAYALLVWGVV